MPLTTSNQPSVCVCVYIYIYIYIYIYENIWLFKFSRATKVGNGPVDWSCRIHQLHLCRGVRPQHNQVSKYDTKQSDGEALVMLLNSGKNILAYDIHWLFEIYSS